MHNPKGLRSPIARVRGLGSAKHGTAHWWTLRLTSIALIFLTGWFVMNLAWCLAVADYAAAHAWLKQPVSAALMALFLATGFHHGANGLQTVIEDYFHCEAARLVLIVLVKFSAAVFAIIGIVALGKIVFGG